VPSGTPHSRQLVRKENDVYDYLWRGSARLPDDAGHEAVSYHRGSCADFLSRHQKDAGRAVRDGVRGIRELAPYLFERIADTRTMRAAWDFLARQGGQAPGPDRHRYGDYTTAEVWDLSRCLARAVRAGTYRPGPERIHWVEKGAGRGRRPIVLMNIADRVVQRAIVLVLQPVLDPLFDPWSFGYRPKISHLHALALAERLTLSRRRPVWVIDDLQDAFRHVPVPRLVQVVRKLLPADDLLELLDVVLPAQELPGLRQGGSLSPLMLNLYLNHVLDRAWRRDRPRLPLIRVADDLLVLCRTEGEAHDACGHLRHLLRPAGMPLKGPPEAAVRRLDDGDSADWLGFRIHQPARGLAFEIGERSWERLATHLALAHTKSDAPVRAIHTLKQWLNPRGPCYTSSDRDRVCLRMIELARAQAFEEVPSPQQLRQHWQRAYARWRKLRRAVRLNEAADAPTTI
jgi:hypothetical protein